MTLPFKAVAVDMDGTFLNEKRTFDKEEFDHILTALHQENVQFIVASGRPFVRLKEDFAGFVDRIDFVSVNGARLIAAGKEVGMTAMSRETILKLIAYGEANYNDVTTLVYGPDCSYMLKSAPQHEKKFMAYFAKTIVEIEKWEALPEGPYVELTFNCGREYAQAIEEGFNAKYGKLISAFGSADFAVDVNAYGVNKASGLKNLLTTFGLSGDDLIAYGDGGNDIPMLKLAKYSYAMENGMDEVKKIAKYRAPKNSENGVFKVLESYLNKEVKD